MIVLFISAGAYAQTPEERLFEAIEEGKSLVAEGIVARGGVKLDARKTERGPPLHLAIEKWMKELAAMLVKVGAPVNARSMNSERHCMRRRCMRVPISWICVGSNLQRASG